MKTLLLIAACLMTLQKAAAQSVSPANVPSKTTTRQPIAEGANVWAFFMGAYPARVWRR
jgi:hypothetical protein